MNINRSSIQCHRQQQFTQVTRCLKSEFASGIPLTVHRDGKLMEDVTGKQHVDRLPGLVSGVGVTQLLGVPNTTGTGRDQACCVVEVLTEWNSTDLWWLLAWTRQVPTPVISRMHVLSSIRLKRDLACMACRHHVIELLAAAFNVTFCT